MAGETPYGFITQVTSQISYVQALNQLVVSRDTNNNILSLGTTGEMMDLVAILFNAKTAAATGRTTSTGNFSIDTPIVVSRASAEIRMVNNNPFATEVDFYECDVKATTQIDAASYWNAAYSNIHYSYNGTQGPQSSGDWYASPNETPLFSTFYRTKKSTFSLLPGQEKKFFIKGRTGTLLPMKYAGSTSTVAVPVINQGAAGWTKYFFYVLRGQLAACNTTLMGVVTLHPSHAQASGNPSGSCFIMELKTNYKFEAPEGTAVANRLDKLIHNYWTDAPDFTKSVWTIDNVNNPLPVNSS